MKGPVLKLELIPFLNTHLTEEPFDSPFLRLVNHRPQLKSRDTDEVLLQCLVTFIRGYE